MTVLFHCNELKSKIIDLIIFNDFPCDIAQPYYIDNFPDDLDYAK